MLGHSFLPDHFHMIIQLTGESRFSNEGCILRRSIGKSQKKSTGASKLRLLRNNFGCCHAKSVTYVINLQSMSLTNSSGNLGRSRASRSYDRKASARVGLPIGD